jgi:hypothetical protein
MADKLQFARTFGTHRSRPHFPVLAAIDAETQVASLARVGLRTAFQHDASVPTAPLDREVRNELPAASLFECLIGREGYFIWGANGREQFQLAGRTLLATNDLLEWYVFSVHAW